MARISDKHGLTNEYREIGLGKRVVRKGRPRKHLVAVSKRKKQTKTKEKIKLSLQTPTTKDALGCLGCGGILLIAFVIFCIIIAH